MIEQIIKLREEGLSFHKIALELNTTVGKVQYRWNKWLQNHLDNAPNPSLSKDTESSEDRHSSKNFQSRGILQIKPVTPRKIKAFWEVSQIPKKLIQIYFKQDFETLIHVIRIYDVQDINFNGNNAHYFQEAAIHYNNGHWYIKGLRENRRYIAELGVYLSDSVYLPILRSNSFQTQLTNKKYDDFVQIQPFVEEIPKWKNHVSTYSYYEKTKILEGKNG